MPASDAEQVDITQTADGAEFGVKVVPGASRSRVAGVWQSSLKVTVSAPPDAGRANDAVVALLATTLGCKKRDVAIVHGRSKPHKRIRVQQLSAAELLSRLRETLRDKS